MESLNKLLGRIRQSLGQDSANKEVISIAIKEVLGFEVRLQDISIQGDALRIQTSPAKKTEIRLHEQAVLAEVRKRTRLNLKRIQY